MLPAISPAVISHLAMPNSGVRRYAAALQSLVSAGARDRLARAEEPVVCRLCAGGGQSRANPSLLAVPCEQGKYRELRYSGANGTTNFLCHASEQPRRVLGRLLAKFWTVIGPI